MREKITWVTSDGIEFSNRKKAKDHEWDLYSSFLTSMVNKTLQPKDFYEMEDFILSNLEDFVRLSYMRNDVKIGDYDD